MTVCDSIECQNGGHCDIDGSTFKCKCPFGWTGELCQIDVNECASNPCINGQCLNKNGKNNYNKSMMIVHLVNERVFYVLKSEEYMVIYEVLSLL